MPDRRFTILSTAPLPFDRISFVPDSVDVQVVPFIQIRPRSGSELITFITEWAEEKISVIFTSAHAVKTVAGLMKRKPDWNIYCIRNETRMAVVNAFGEDVQHRFADSALSLSRLIISDGIKRALFFCGDQRLDILPDNLKKNGVELIELIVYDTILNPVRIDDPPDIILFFSPTAVKSFFALNEISSGTAIFAMGTSTAEALKHNTSHPVIISPEADKAYVFNMALNFVASHPII